MKNIFFLFSFILLAGGGAAQSKPGIPPFRILKTDSTWFTPADIRKHKPVMIIYFSPDCSHCEHLMKELKPEIKKFGDTQIIMITYVQPIMLQEVRDFYRKYGLDKYPNVIVGTEGYTLLVQKYYQITITPYIAVYTRDGKLIKSFAKAPAMEELISTVKKG